MKFQLHFMGRGNRWEEQSGKTFGHHWAYVKQD